MKSDRILARHPTADRGIVEGLEIVLGVLGHSKEQAHALIDKRQGHKGDLDPPTLAACRALADEL